MYYKTVTKQIMKNGKVKDEEKIIYDFKKCFKNLINKKD